MIRSDSNSSFKDKVFKIIRRDVFITFLSVLGVSLILLGNSYALFTSFNTSKEYNAINIGTLKMEYTDVDVNKSLNLTDSLPMTDADGLKTKGYRFSLTNDGTLATKYAIRLVDDNDLIKIDECADKLLPKNFIKVSIDNSVPVLLSSLKEADYTLIEGTLQPGEKIVYSLKAWLDIESDNTIFNKHYHGKLLIEGLRDDLQSPLGLVKDLLLDATRIGEQASIVSNDSEQIFIAGSNPNNYLWYSGKLWRVISIDNNGYAKLVTDEIITVIPYGKNNQEFTDTYAYDWLNSVFYPSLKETDKYLVDYNYSVDKTTSLEKPGGNKKNFKVGLLHPYEYSMTNKNGNYLNIKMNYALLSYQTNNNIWMINGSGELKNQNSLLYIGIRPVVNFNNDVAIISGDGTKTNPYRLKGDNEKYFANLPLNSRISGEYVSYNGLLFRIVTIKDSNTKLVSVNNVAVSKFDDYVSNYNKSTDIQGYLNNSWLSSLDSNYSSMLTEGSINNGNVQLGSSYKTSQNTSFQASVGLLTVGDLFSSWISESTSLGTSFYLANNVTDGRVPTITNSNSLNEIGISVSTGVRVVVYLKSNVIITSGLGTVTSPFQIVSE